MVGEVDRRFGREFERIAVLPLPGLQRGKKTFQSLLVADEVVVDKVHVSAITECVEPIEFGHHLLVRLGAWHPTVKFDDVAKLAIERAAA